ncbi:MAG TPA: murein biosynthesis integral membrane protein MurJ [Desulfomonilia bacterium]|nr:murein biosynthesis integral membrane protein MurJ [Desulfomonilia bacterium]
MRDGFKKNVVTVGGLTAVSRILGFIRDMVMAWLLGAGPLADAFVVANRIPNLLRRFMAEGAVSVAFVPVFSEVKEREGIEKAYIMAQEIMTLMFYGLVAVVIIGEIIAPALVAIMAPGFIHSSVFAVTVHLTRIMFPYILLIGVAVLFMGILNSIGHFAAPAAAPILMNLFMISVPLLCFVVFPVFTSPADSFAWGVIIGGIAQIIIQIPPLLKRRVPLRPTLTFHSSRVKQVIRLLGVAAIGASIYQINVLIGTLFASLLSEGSVSYLYYANRLLELPLGIFAFAVGNVMLPAMSSASARMDSEQFSFLMGRGLTAVLLFTIPATIGACVLARPIFTILFMRGAFSFNDALESAYALQMYGVSLWAVGYTRIQTQALYAMQKAKAVVNISWMSLVVNIVFCIILMPFLQHAGIALASSISVFAQLLIQHKYLRKEGIYIPKEYIRHFGKMVASSLIMGVVLVPLGRMYLWRTGLTVKSGALLLLCVSLGGSLYFGLLWAMGMRGFGKK